MDPSKSLLNVYNLGRDLAHVKQGVISKLSTCMHYLTKMMN